MAISVKTRRIAQRPDMVLYVDVQIRPDGKGLNRYLAEIHEASQADLKAFPSLPCDYPPLLHSYGVRVEELSATLALIDILLGHSHSAGHRAFVESRLLQAADNKVKRLLVCNKVHHEGKLSNPMLAENRLALFATRDPSRLVPNPETAEDEAYAGRTTLLGKRLHGPKDDDDSLSVKHCDSRTPTPRDGAEHKQSPLS